MPQKVVGSISGQDSYGRQLIRVSLSHGCSTLFLSLILISPWGRMTEKEGMTGDTNSHGAQCPLRTHSWAEARRWALGTRSSYTTDSAPGWLGGEAGVVPSTPE